MTPVERTLAYLRRENIPAESVQRWIAFGKGGGVRRDLFRIVDVLALDGGFIGIQVCGADLTPHIIQVTVMRKVESLRWLSAGGDLEIWSWTRLKAGWQKRTVIIYGDRDGGVVAGEPSSEIVKARGKA